MRSTATPSEGRSTAQWGREITTLGGAFRDFMHRRSPWLILGAVVLVAAARIAIGDFGWADVIAVARAFTPSVHGIQRVHTAEGTRWGEKAPLANHGFARL